MNSLYGCMVRSIAIQQQHHMGSLDSGGQTTDEDRFLARQRMYELFVWAH